MPRKRNSRKKAKIIPIDKKMQLIQDVFQNFKSVHQSSIEIGLKYSTAKAIVKRYRENNTVQRRNSKRNNVRYLRQESEVAQEENNSNGEQNVTEKSKPVKEEPQDEPPQVSQPYYPFANFDYNKMFAQPPTPANFCYWNMMP